MRPRPAQGLKIEELGAEIEALGQKGRPRRGKGVALGLIGPSHIGGDVDLIVHGREEGAALAHHHGGGAMGDRNDAADWAKRGHFPHARSHKPLQPFKIQAGIVCADPCAIGPHLARHARPRPVPQRNLGVGLADVEDQSQAVVHISSDRF